MHTHILEGVVTALTSISHIGETIGISARLRREKVAQPDGRVEDVPIISGNSLRGILRDVGMLHMLTRLGYAANQDDGTIAGISLPAFYFLFSGGALTKDSASGLDIDRAREWRQLVPLVGVFGGAMGNQIMPGRIKVGKLIPICIETAHIIPERYAYAEMPSVWDIVQEEAYTRSDDEKNDHLRGLIDAPQRRLLEAASAQKRARRGTDQDVVPATGRAQQMRYYTETIASGARFYWSVTIDDATDLEFEAFLVCLREFARKPYVGGKSGIGHGKIMIQMDKWIRIDPRLAPAGQEVDFVLGDCYEQHLAAQANNIRRLIDDLK